MNKKILAIVFFSMIFAYVVMWAEMDIITAVISAVAGYVLGRISSAI